MVNTGRAKSHRPTSTIESNEREKSRSRLLTATQRMLADVESRTGKPVELRPEPQLDGRARGTYAVSDPDRSRHLLLYDPAKIDLLDHIVPHELGHVEMFESADPAGRLVPVVVEQDRQLARKNLLRELVATRRVLP